MDGEEDYMAQMPIINESKFEESIKPRTRGAAGVLPVPVPISRTAWRKVRRRGVLACRASHLDIPRNGCEEKIAMQEHSEMEVTGRQISICENIVSDRVGMADLRKVNGLLRLFVVWSEVLGRKPSAVVRPAIDGPVLQDAGCNGCSRALSSI